jgi:4-aminobutyrate aminotransferase / (S)-3-amino-2-methylpropionate transaminase / 5-aminovalerate transaminase
MGSISITTSIPGPQSLALNQRRAAAVSSGLAQANPIAVASAHGSVVTDVDGNRFIDLAGGIGALAVGHTPPEVVAAIQRQAQDLIHACAIVVNYEPYVALSEALNALVPTNTTNKTLLANGGAEAVENAVKLARRFTNRAGIVVFEGAYHGRSNLTMAMTSKYGLFKKGFGPFAPEIYRLPLPNLYRTPPGMSQDEYLEYCCWNLENALVSHIDGSALAAIVIEPVVGEGGFLPVPPKFLQKIRHICDQTGALMVADEIQSGFGRTGKIFAIEHAMAQYPEIIPDLLVSAKSLGAGMPISAVTGRADVLDSPHIGGVGSTYGGNPLACAAALAAAARVETIVREVFEPLLATVPVLGDVRGIGAMMALEFVKDQHSKQPYMEIVPDMVKHALQNGVILIRAGLYSNCLRFLPQLDIPEAQLREALAVVAEAIETKAKTLL